MNGNNTLDINRPTMNEALQHWLNTTQFKKPVEVTGVSFRSGNPDTFEITFKPAEGDTAP